MFSNWNWYSYCLWHFGEIGGGGGVVMVQLLGSGCYEGIMGMAGETFII
jgi:hypothetical protein